MTMPGVDRIFRNRLQAFSGRRHRSKRESEQKALVTAVESVTGLAESSPARVALFPTGNEIPATTVLPPSSARVAAIAAG